MSSVHKIVITGGPCAGKSTAMSWIQNAFTQLGYNVLFIPETATQLIGSGITPWGCKSSAHYQVHQMKMQLAKEKIYEDAVWDLKNNEKILIVCDRGALDNRAYMSELEFNTLLEKLHLDEVRLRDEYDAVFHLVTAAKGAVEFYTLANNQARTETVEQAIELDDKIISAWTGHPHLRVIDNSSDFESKMNRLISEISTFLGEPEPYEIERKFLIEYPDIAWLESNQACQKVDIIQTYLNSDNDNEVRIRQRGINGTYIYFETTKRKVSELKRVETERRLSEQEYLKLMMDADTSKHQIRKTRYCLMYNNQYIEIDVYPFWKDKAIAEVEISHEDTQVKFPEQIKVIKEVTDDASYKNYELASIY